MKTHRAPAGGWTGFSTQDLKRSQLMDRIVALVFNWWSIFTRIGTGDKHGEAITTRPLLMKGVDAWGGAADLTWWPEVFELVEFARQGEESGPVTGGDQRVAERPEAKCGAVREKCSLAGYAANHFSVLLRRQRWPTPTASPSLAVPTAVFRITGIRQG